MHSHVHISRARYVWWNLVSGRLSGKVLLRIADAMTERRATLFNLPPFTLAVVLGVPLLWILYTCVFLYISRNYKSANSDQ